MRAMILAAGRGERMRPLTDHTPKPLLEAGGRPLIEWTIERLVRAGCRELVINHAHLGARIERALGDGARLGATIRYSPEESALETAGGIANALALLGPAPFIVVNGDIHCDFDFGRLRDRAGRWDAATLCHIVLVANPPHHPGGDFSLGALRTDGAAALSGSAVPRYTYSGIGLYRPALFSAVASGSRAPLAPLLRAAAAGGQASAELHAGAWTDVGTPARLATLDAQLRADMIGRGAAGAACLGADRPGESSE